jgi:hypothetical protein
MIAATVRPAEHISSKVVSTGVLVDVVGCVDGVVCFCVGVFIIVSYTWFKTYLY